MVEYHLPDGNGTLLVEKLKLLVSDALVTVLLSVYDAEVIAEEANRAGVDLVLTKLFDPAVLGQTLALPKLR